MRYRIGNLGRRLPEQEPMPWSANVTRSLDCCLRRRAGTAVLSVASVTTPELGSTMQPKDGFNDDEWYLLGATPAMIGVAMSTAAPSGLVGTVKEIAAGMRASIEGVDAFPDSALIAQLLERSANWDAAKERAQDYRARSQERFASARIRSRAQLIDHMVADC